MTFVRLCFTRSFGICRCYKLLIEHDHLIIWDVALRHIRRHMTLFKILTVNFVLMNFPFIKILFYTSCNKSTYYSLIFSHLIIYPSYYNRFVSLCHTIQEKIFKIQLENMTRCKSGTSKTCL